MTNKMIFINNECFHCGFHSFVQVKESDYKRWKAGELIQNVWPDSTPAWREMLKTGIHSKCWDEIFSDED